MVDDKLLDSPIRVNTRISVRYNKWLDQRSLETSLSKSSIINVAIENYIKETEVTGNLEEMLSKVKGLDDLRSEIAELKKQLAEIVKE